MTIYKRIQKPIRIRPKAIEIYKFLDYDNTKKDKSKYLFDSILEYSLDYLNDKKTCPLVTEFLGRREVNGFTLSEENLNKLFSFHKNNQHLMIAEIVELSIYLYAKNNLSETEFDFLDIDYIKDGYMKVY